MRTAVIVGLIMLAQAITVGMGIVWHTPGFVTFASFVCLGMDLSELVHKFMTTKA